MKKIIQSVCAYLVLIIILSACSSDGDTIVNSQNYDETKIEESYELISHLAGIRSLLISYNDEIIGVEYFNNTGPEPDSILDVRSVTKSITSLLIGIALDKGYLTSLDQTVSEFLSNSVTGLNEEKGNITIRQLLTMTSGHVWYEIGDSSEFKEWIYAPDQLQYIINKPIVNTPGTVFNYSDGGAHLVSAILYRATGMRVDEFAQANLLNPLGIGQRFWYEDNRGINYGGVGICLGPEDMMKIGRMVLHKGLYNGKRIVSENWINESTATQVSTNNVLPYLTGYGYFWWKGNQNGHEFKTAMGYGGQFILVVEDLNLVVVTTCDFLIPKETAGQNWTSIINIIMNNIIPAFD